MNKKLRELEIIITAAENGFITKGEHRKSASELSPVYVTTNTTGLGQLIKKLCDSAANEKED